MPSNLALDVYLLILQDAPSDIFGLAVDHQFLLFKIPSQKYV